MMFRRFRTRKTPLSVLFQGYRRRKNRFALQRALKGFTKREAPFGKQAGLAATTFQLGGMIGKGAPVPRFTPQDIVEALRDQLRREYPPASETPQAILSLVEQLKKAEKVRVLADADA